MYLAILVNINCLNWVAKQNSSICNINFLLGEHSIQSSGHQPSELHGPLNTNFFDTKYTNFGQICYFSVMVIPAYLTYNMKIYFFPRMF